MSDELVPDQETIEPQAVESALSLWKLTSWVCCVVIIGSILACVIIAAMQSEGLKEIKVTALNAAAEPRDHDIPLIKQKEALPDYELLIITQELFSNRLGVKPDTSAVEGLVWKLQKPISVDDIVGIRLQDQDKLMSDVLVEVPFSHEPVVAGNYRFEFQTVHSVRLGIESFFQTPIGISIAFAFVIAILLMLSSLFIV